MVRVWFGSGSDQFGSILGYFEISSGQIRVNCGPFWVPSILFKLRSDQSSLVRVRFILFWSISIYFRSVRIILGSFRVSFGIVRVSLGQIWVTSSLFREILDN